jgi:RNA polymerase sigma-70 factor (ECF subfamily)
VSLVSIFQGRPDLLSRFRAGDRAALEEVYWAYVERVEAIARNGFAKVAGASSEDVADVVQETFARAFSDEARLRFDGLRDYAPFLWSITRHALAESWRRAGRHQSVPDIETLAELSQDGASEVEPIDAALARAVEEYIATLSPEMSAVHRELYVLGRSQREAASATGITRQSLRTLEKRLRKGLAAALKRKGLTP